MKSFRSLLILAVSTQSLVQGNLRGNNVSSRSLESIRRLEEENILKTYRKEAEKFAFPDTTDAPIDAYFNSVGISLDVTRMIPTEKVKSHSSDEP